MHRLCKCPCDCPYTLSLPMTTHMSVRMFVLIHVHMSIHSSIDTPVHRPAHTCLYAGLGVSISHLIKTSMFDGIELQRHLKGPTRSHQWDALGAANQQRRVDQLDRAHSLRQSLPVSSHLDLVGGARPLAGRGVLQRTTRHAGQQVQFQETG